jgi:hypothetical protein
MCNGGMVKESTMVESSNMLQEAAVAEKAGCFMMGMQRLWDKLGGCCRQLPFRVCFYDRSIKEWGAKKNNGGAAVCWW